MDKPLNELQCVLSFHLILDVESIKGAEYGRQSRMEVWQLLVSDDHFSFNGEHPL